MESILFSNIKLTPSNIAHSPIHLQTPPFRRNSRRAHLAINV